MATTIVIPYHEERRANGMLDRAVASAHAQTLPAAHVVLEPDPDRTGSAATRNRALDRIDTDWVLWLDSDDQLTPHALQLLTEAQQRTGADVVSGAAWIPQTPSHTEPTTPVPPGQIPAELVRERSRLTVTSLMRVDLARTAGGFEFTRDPGTGMELDDYGLYRKLADLGAVFWRIPDTILIWHVHGRNTSGQPNR